MITLLVSLAILYLALILAVSFLSVKPVRLPVFFSPGSVDAPQEEVSFTSGRETLRGWWIEAGGEVVAILCHGYVMNRSELSPLAVWLWRRGISSLVFDFRAHGRSEGNRSSFGVREADDVTAAVGFARARYPNAKVILIGSSMGGAACALALSRDPALANALVLDCAYSRLWVAGLGWWRFLGGRILQVAFSPTLLFGWLFSGVNPFSVDVGAALTRLKGKPVLIIHGDADTLAPPSEAERNKAAVGESARLVWLAGCGHAEGRWLLPDVYHDAIEAFLKDHRLLPLP